MAIIKKPTSAPQAGADADRFIEGAPDATPKAGVIRGHRRQITLTIAPELLAQVDVIAQRMGQSRAAFINMAIYRAIQGEDASGAP